ncbi:hypothetical protein [Roseivivax isoporae]|uniref:Uncharacterized protein n=1 Tax=Roseivivax isoporae LMG 25204 TaxID=1449351 RepID=X7F488_9RHOB|nr:hypothetical protein [Roseivivax isoporae]ETX27610.1 hypothetical protein RISW2_13295 [Roseivivax isoporae LMG 25204]
MPDGTMKRPEPARDFRLDDLQAGRRDPRGRLVRDILWAVDEFKIYRTDAGISPFFSDDPDLAREQKGIYLRIGEGIADFNHLIHTLRPHWWVVPVETRRRADLVHYERELARCIAQALLGHENEAAASLVSLRQRLAARIANRARVVHLMINVILVAVAIVGALSFARSSYVSAFAFDVKEFSLAVMMGAVGALFSTTVRLQSMEVDPTVTQMMHWVYGAQRVLVGAMGALVIYFGFRSGVLTGLFQPPSGTALPIGAGRFDPYWLSFICVMAGFSERLVPNLLDGQAAQMMRGTPAEPDRPRG